MFSSGLLAHIEALRKMVLEILVIFVLLLIPGWFFAGDVLSIMQYSAIKTAEKYGNGSFALNYFSLMEPFTTELKTGMLLAFAGGLPLYFWRIWRFVAPALYRHEKKIILSGAIAVWVLFFAGFAMGMFAVMPMLVKFSFSFARNGLMPVIGLNNYVGLAMSVSIAFGAMFELPLLLLVLAAAGIIKLDTLRKQRPLVLIIILVLAAILTPPDVVSQLLLGVPTYLLFELMLFCGGFLIKDRKGQDAEADNLADADESNENDSADAVSVEAYSTNVEDNGYIPCYRRKRPVRRNNSVRNKLKKGYR